MIELVCPKMDVPKYAELSKNDKLAINYLCNLRNDKNYNIRYFEDRKVIVVRNCDSNGNLLDLKLPKSSFLLVRPWEVLTVKTFEDQGVKFEVPICQSCDRNIGALSNKNDYRRISSGHVTQFGDSLVIAFLSA